MYAFLGEDSGDITFKGESRSKSTCWVYTCLVPYVDGPSGV